VNAFAEIYDRPEVVAEFHGTDLELPEARLWCELARRPGALTMLDLGVGAGRTTGFFAPLCQRYRAIDIAPRMVAACRERFGGLAHCEFHVADAADLAEIDDAMFDIVLFSFNGLDCLDYAAREKCLRAVRMRLRSGGLFLFSAHNLQAIDMYFREPDPGSEAARGLPAERREKIARYNDSPESYACRSWAMFWDGVYGDDGGLRHLYIKPGRQVADLHAAGFGRVEVLSTVTGDPHGEDSLDTVSDLSIAYWCEAAP